VDQQRIDQQQPGHRQRQRPTTAGRRAQCGGQHRHAGHGGGPQHRRLEAGHHAEQSQHAEGDHDPTGEGQTTKERADDEQDEGDVLAGHRQQVREPGPAEGVDECRRLAPVVAEGEPDQQAALIGVEGRRSPGQQGPVAVRQARGKATGAPAQDPCGLQATGEVTAGLPGPRGGERLDPTPDRHPIAGEPVGERVTGRPAGPGLQVASTEANLGPHLVTEPLRVGQEGHLGLDGLPLDVAEPGEGRRGQGPGQDEHPEAHEPGPPHPEGDADQHRARPPGHRDGEARSHPGNGHQGEDDPFRHGGSALAS
jgi:hypothetical protein